MTFAEDKEIHLAHGHNYWVGLAFMRCSTNTHIRNVCRDLRCDDIDEHFWEQIVFRGEPAMKCLICGFVWKSDMRKPRVTCEKVLSDPRKKDPALTRS